MLDVWKSVLRKARRSRSRSLRMVWLLRSISSSLTSTIWRSNVSRSCSACLRRFISISIWLLCGKIDEKKSLYLYWTLPPKTSFIMGNLRGFSAFTNRKGFYIDSIKLYSAWGPSSGFQQHDLHFAATSSYQNHSWPITKFNEILWIVFQTQLLNCWELHCQSVRSCICSLPEITSARLLCQT